MAVAGQWLRRLAWMLDVPVAGWGTAPVPDAFAISDDPLDEALIGEAGESGPEKVAVEVLVELEVVGELAR
jgi:hypothetical protein